ncbi:MAG: DUF6431 domain-containing protein [Oscillospiraceae bacterium]|nr:DUF6431 domain-containing protein [Oscillospiraceae bacterium]
MVIITQYRMKKKHGTYFIRSEESSICPVCSVLLLVIGSRKRGVIGSDGWKLTLVLRRLRCQDCRTIHHELPDTVVPYKRHCAEIIEKVIAGDIESVCCEERTIRRLRAWWAVCLLYFENVLASLREKYGTVFSVCPAPREIIRAVANANLWVHTRSTFLTG